MEKELKKYTCNVGDRIVCFHIGRGGRFFNGGHKSYNSHVTCLQDCFGKGTIISEDEEGNELPEEQWQLIDSGDNIILTGRAEISSETGVLDWDGEYDTDIVKHLCDCTDDEYQILLDTKENGDWIDADIVHYAAYSLGLDGDL